ncbi:MAG: radical SAM protein [Halanaerobiales bacterium]|nr:radical SAM protein [Halanaerobiales bacterium]
MDVILIRTPKGSPKTGDPAPYQNDFLDYYEDLAVSYLAASLRQEGYTCKVIDQEWKRLEEKELAHLCVQEDCNVFALSIHAYGFLKVGLRIAMEIKTYCPNAIIILGGHPLTDLDDSIMEMFDFIDFVCRGEGEKILPQLMEAIKGEKDYSSVSGLTYREKGRIIRDDNTPRCTDLDQLPFPSRDLWESDSPKPYYALVLGSRGCYGRCKMCSVRAFYGGDNHHWIGRSPENLVEELEHLNQKYGIKIFSIIDPEFIGPGERGKKRATKIAELIMKKELDIKFDIACRVNDVDREVFSKLKDAGLYKVFLGVESGVQKVLDQLCKLTTVEENLSASKVLHDLNLQIETGFIMIMPDSTIDDIQQNLKFIKKFKCFQPYRLGSRLYTHPNFEISKELEDEKVVFGNLLEKRYYIQDFLVQQYYDVWLRLYSYASKGLRKINLLFIHSLWQQDVLDQIYQIQESVLFYYIGLLEKAISIILRQKLTEEQLEFLTRSMEEFMEIQREKINKLVEEKSQVMQYPWIERKVEIIDKGVKKHV